MAEPLFSREQYVFRLPRPGGAAQGADWREDSQNVVAGAQADRRDTVGCIAFGHGERANGDRMAWGFVGLTGWAYCVLATAGRLASGKGMHEQAVVAISVRYRERVDILEKSRCVTAAA